jgi:hypothetical protein
MNQFRIILLLSLVVLGCEGVKISTLPALPVKMSIPAGRTVDWYAEKYPDAPGVYLWYRQVDEFNSGRWTHIEKQYLVLNPDNTELSTFHLELPSWLTLKSIRILIQNPDGSEHRFIQPNMSKQVDSYNNTTYKLAFPDVKRGTLVAIHYTLLQGGAGRSPLSDIVDPLRTSLPADTISVKYIFPTSYSLTTKRNTNVYVRDFFDISNQKRILSMGGKDVPPIEPEIYAPFYKEWAEYIQFRTLKPNSGQSDFKYWFGLHAAVSEFLFPSSFLGMAEQLDLMMTQNNYKQLSDSAKIWNAARWVSDNIELKEWLGPQSPATLFNSKKGNSASMSQMLYYMYRKLGLNVVLVLGSGANNGALDESYVTLEEFDEPGVIVQLEDKDYFVQPHKKYQPITFVSQNMIDRDALIIRRAIISAKTTNLLRRLNLSSLVDRGYENDPEMRGVKTVSLVGIEASPNLADEHLSVTLLEDGSARVTERVQLVSSFANSMREELNAKDAPVHKWVLENYISYDLNQIKTTRQEFLNLNDRDKPLILELEYIIPDLLNVTDDEMVFQTGGFLSQNALKPFSTEKEIRRAPISIRREEVQNRTITITAPPGWSCSTAIENRSIENKFGRQLLRASADSNVVRISYERILHKNEAPKEDYPELLKLIGRKPSLQIPYLVFSRKK